MHLLQSNKRITWLLGIFSFVIFSLLIGSKLGLFHKTSPEMLVLRQVEQQLTLPEPNTRYEKDEGCHRDWAGANQCSTSIMLNYGTRDVYADIQKSIPQNEWRNSRLSKYATKNEELLLVKQIDSTKVCLSLYRHGPTHDSEYLILSAAPTNVYCSEGD